MRDSVTIAFEFDDVPHAPAEELRAPQQNILPFSPFPPPVRQLEDFAAPDAALFSFADDVPQTARQHSLLDEPLEPLSDRLNRIAASPDLELTGMLDRYARAEAEETERAETGWFTDHIADTRAEASLENTLNNLIADFERRQNQANLYVAAGIGGAMVLTLIALSAFLMLSG